MKDDKKPVGPVVTTKDKECKKDPKDLTAKESCDTKKADAKGEKECKTESKKDCKEDSLDE